MFRERAFLLTGQRSGRVWLMRRRFCVVGTFAAVEANWYRALHSEERRGDVMGFFHSHPPGAGVNPSLRDIRTMQAWCSSFGKPLLCVIVCGDQVQSSLFEDEDSQGQVLPVTELFSRGVVVAVEW